VLDDDGRTVRLGGPKERRVLAVLAVHIDEPVSEARLADVLWGDEPPPTATKTLQTYISRLRKALGAGGDLRIDSVESGYVLRSAPDAVDRVEVDALIASAREAVGRGDHEVAAERLRAAERHWRGPVLGDLADEPFARAESARLEELRLSVVEERLEVELACGCHADLVGELEALVGRHPMRERLWGARMVALYRSGRQADALRAYQDLRALLRDELGIDPSPELRSLEAAILLQGPELDWVATAPAAPPAARPALAARPPLPRALERDDRCVGREGELARLDNHWAKAQDGFRQAVLIAGEPGIGKTSLAAALARRAHDGGALVLYGRCDEDVGSAFQPFTEALRALVAALPDDQLRALGHHAAHLARLLPELGERLPGLAPTIPADAAAERYSLFEAVVALLAGATVDAPVLFVLDDLHWGAKPTLLLLRHVLRAEVEMRLLVVATYRDTEVDRSHAFAEVLADLRRDVAVERFALAGLDRGAVQHLVETAAGQELDGRALELSDTLHRQTSGNPFFVAEVLRHLAESGAVYQGSDGWWTSDLAVDELGLPEGVRDVVGRRLSRLSAMANQAMTVAAVSGPRFELRLLEAIPDAGPRESVLDALEEGVSAGLLAEDRGTFAFPHALVRQTLLEELSSTRRLRLHRVIGEALESIAPDDVAALAFHFAEAAADGAAVKAGDYALAAARRSRDHAAYEEAVSHLERGLEAIELTVPVDRVRRCDLLLELGELQRWLSNDPAARSRIGVRAAEDARAIGSPERLARAALVAQHAAVGAPDPVGAALVEEALAAVREDDLIARVQLLTRLAVHRTESEGRREEGDVLAAEAMRLARGGPPEVAALAIAAAWSWGDMTDLAELIEKVFALPVELQTVELLTIGTQARAVAAFEHGDLATFDAAAAELRELTDETHGWYSAYVSLVFSITRALLDGRWAAAEEALALLATHAGEDPNALNVWAGSQFLLLREQGRHDELLPLIENAAESNTGIAGFRAALALLQAELGHLELAAATLAPLAGEAVGTIPRNQTIASTLATVAEVAARIRDPETCLRAYERMVAFAGRLAHVAGTLTVGAGDRYLGMLAATLGRYDVAQGHYEVAIDLEARVGSRPYLTRTRTWYGRMLLERDAPGDGDRAGAMLSTALADADELGMAVVAAEIRGLLQPPPPYPATRDHAEG
jgi:DNA-binding SARP family transcriptional activator